MNGGSMRLTMLASPKPFTGYIGIIQRNAITSWTRLYPRPEIVLFGEDAGTADLCLELGLTHRPAVQRNDRGTPLLNDVLAQGTRLATQGPMCFINADIILMNDFARAVDRVASEKKSFLMIGQRTDLDMTAPIAFDDPGWPESLRSALTAGGRLHGEDGIDYFVFTQGIFDPVPPLLVGRAAIDNWLVFRARARWRTVIDATAAVTAVHQNHDYSHHPEGRAGVYAGDEAQTNLQLAGGLDHLFWINDRTHRLTTDSLRLDLQWKQLRRHWDRLPVLVPHAVRPIVLLLQMLQRGIGAGLRMTGLRTAQH